MNELTNHKQWGFGLVRSDSSLAMESSFNRIKNTTTHFEFCIKPLLVVMRLIGIEFDPSNAILSSRNSAGLKLSFGLVVFFVNVFAQFIHSVSLLGSPVIFTYLHDPDVIPQVITHSPSGLWSTIADLITFHLLVIGSHAVLLSLVWRTEWRRLWKNLQQMGETGDVSSINYTRTCRRIVYLAIVLLTMVNTF